MHYGIITYGSRGDVQPYIGLAIGLMEKRHQVTLLANENFRDFVEGYGVNFYPLHGNMEDMVHAPEVLGLLQSGNMVSYLRQMRKMMRNIQPEVNSDMFEGCQGIDVLIASPLTLIWVYSIAEKLNKKWAIIQLSMPATPTREFPFAGFAFFNMPSFNLFSHGLVRYIYWRLNKKDINEHRITLKLPPLKPSIIKNIADQKILNLYAFSPALIIRPKDWPEQVDITGFFTVPASTRKMVLAEQPSQKLIQWLQDSEAPIYIGFGSIPIPDTKKFAAIIDELIAKTTERFIFCQGWSELPNLPRHERLFVVNYINHEWLFPQCKTAIVHGGIGTVAAVLNAKIPVIIVSIFGDQPLWGRLIARKKLGVHLPFKKLTTRKLMQAIENAQTSAMRKMVEHTGDTLHAEDGVRTTIDALENYFR